MAAPTAAEHSTGEVFPWLKTLPTAPEYHPTIQEFQDPISYIFKIEKEASRFGICKIVPPVPPQPKKTVISNFNRSLSKRSSSPLVQNLKSLPTFTTRQQQVGFCPRKHRPVQKPVWQSGEHYTLSQFESKAKGFEKNYLKNRAKRAPPTALELETLYWKANGDRPFSVEYANDMPGSAFMAFKDRHSQEGAETGASGAVAALNVGETAWNMRGISRSSNSLLRFMKDEIPGVTSPMVYVAMLFSWFAWHVEDHDLHSLNFLHMGASKTWYGVPRDAATAFEEVIRVHGYGGETNPIVTFSTLGEKTTVMSPEVLIKTGVPCCRLVQNAGEFVVTFPRAYHSGFSHGYNVGEASNIATPEWLLFARDAAIRRASINYPPMVSHFQLLYDLAMALSSSSSVCGSSAPRSSRLKDKKKVEGEALIKKLFVEDVMQNNNLLHALGKGSSIVLLPHNSSEKFACSNLHVESSFNSNSAGVTRKNSSKQLKTFYSTKANFPSEMVNVETATERSAAVVDGSSDRGIFSCVKCGIWPFACVAILQPTESATRHVMSADSTFHDLMDYVESHDGVSCPDTSRNVLEPNSGLGTGFDKKVCMTTWAVDSIHSSHYQVQKLDAESFEMDSNKKESSALGLLAMTYGNSSGSDEDDVKPQKGFPDHFGHSIDVSLGSKSHSYDYVTPCSQTRDTNSAKAVWSIPSSRYEGIDDVASPKRGDFYDSKEFSRVDSDCSGFGEEVSNDSLMTGADNHPSPSVNGTDMAANSDVSGQVKSPGLPPLSRRSDDDFSRLHVFCLEHAAELEQRLCRFGGVHIMLLCHPDYPKVESAAKRVVEEQGKGYCWKNISFRTATKEDEEEIQLALLSEEETPKNGDWTVKLGINLYHTALLCRSPLYNKQMPYSCVIYNAFGCILPSNSPKSEACIRRKRSCRQKKIIMAGKWCGKVWMSNQVHPLLVRRDDEELPEVEEEWEEDRTLSALLRTFEKRDGQSDSFYKSQSASPLLPRETAVSITTAKKGKSKLEIKTKGQNKSSKTMKTQESKMETKTYDSEDSDDVTHWEQRSTGKKKIENRCNKKLRYQEQEVVADGSDPELSREDRPPPQDYGRSTRTKRFKAQAHPQNSSKPVAKQREPTPDPESGVEGWPSSRLRKRAAKPPCEDFEYEIGGSCSLKKQSQSQEMKRSKPSSGTTTSAASPVVIKKGPKMRLPRSMRSHATMKSPAPSMTTGGSKGPIKRGAVGGEKGVVASCSKSRDKEDETEEYLCDVEGCSMSFRTKQELSVHKRNICPVKGCGKKFFSHKYLVQHKRVHEDDRPLKCPWKGCKMTFKWAWARTEHIRVHTGARPYVCKEPGCGQTFRFVSDFSRHKRKTGHSVKKTKTRV